MNEAAITQQADAFAFPSVMRDLDKAIYHELEAANSSGIKIALDQSMAHVKYGEREESTGMRLGTLAHEKIFEPEAKRYIVLAEGAAKNSNAAKELYVRSLSEALELDLPHVEGKAPGKMLDDQITALLEMVEDADRYIVTAEQDAAATRIREAVMAFTPARLLIEDCETELTVLARDPETGCPVKTRWDINSLGHNIIGDLKKTINAGEDAYTRSCRTYRYRLQEWLYPWAGRQNGMDKQFVHIAVEDTPPYGVRLVEFSEDDRRASEVDCKRAFRMFADAFATGIWPGYPEEPLIVRTVYVSGKQRA